jgi:hypothetical protein
MVMTAMTEAPWWYGTLANALAVLLSVWVGMHYRTPEWLAVYGAAALISALLPSHTRLIGVVGLAVGLGVGAGGLYLLRDAHIVLGDAFSVRGGLLSPARDAAALGVTVAWLLLASLYRVSHKW